ncbi:hypothetical protein FJZ19_05750 [Candidatus Pacearchaeota archaeon]|nr:hypothetical protein [Candidatus Pacearchaeota archaeon]
MAKRGKLEIMRDILKIILENKNRIKPNPLLRKSGLSSDRFKEYYFELLKKKLIREINENPKKHIILTEKGFFSLKDINQ